MSKTETFSIILQAVSQETEIPASDILSARRNTECVDARHLLAKLLHATGMYPSTVASLLGISTRAVHYAVTEFDSRMKTNPALRSNYERIRNKLRSNAEITIYRPQR